MNSPLTPAGNNQKMLPPGKKSFLDSFSPKLLKEVVINQKKESSKISDLKDSLAKIFKIEKKSDERQARNIKEQKLLRERQRALDEEAKSEDKKNSSLRDKIAATAKTLAKNNKDILGGFFSFFQDMIKMFIAYKVLDWISDPKNRQNVKNIITFLRGVFDFIKGAVDLAGKIFQGGIAGITATLDTLKKVTGGPVEVLFKIVKNVGLVFGALPAIQPAIEGLIGALKAIPQFIGKIVSTITGAILGGVDKGTDEGVASAGKESGKEAGKTAVKETGEAAGKELTEQAAKSGGKAAGEAAAKSAGKAGAKSGLKAGAKGLGKSLLKKIPGVGLVAGGAFAAGRAMKGDFLGAGLELASGVAGTLPGLGTAASVGIDAALAGRDIAKSQGIPMLAKGGLVKKPTTAVVGEAGAEAIVPLSKLGETVFGPDAGALSKTVKNIIPKFTKLLMLPFTLVGGGILAIMGGIANKFPMLKPIIGMASGFIGNVFNIPKSILRVALKGVDGLSTLARGATGAASAFIGNLGKLFGEKDPNMSGNNPPTVRGLLADILYAVEGKKKNTSAGSGSSSPVKQTTQEQLQQSDPGNPETGSKTTQTASGKAGTGRMSQVAGTSAGVGVTDNDRNRQTGELEANFSEFDHKGKRYKVRINPNDGQYSLYEKGGHGFGGIGIDKEIMIGGPGGPKKGGENEALLQRSHNEVKRFFMVNAQEKGIMLKYLTKDGVKAFNESPEGKKLIADRKRKAKEKAAGGWITGPMSGYPVSLDGGLSTSFIGHGTEWVGMKKAAGGGVNSAFVIPFNTPRTVNNPGLTASRYREAKAGGYVLPQFGIGGKLKQKKLPKPTYKYDKQLVENNMIPTGTEGSFRRYAAGGLYVFSTAPIGPPKMMGKGKGFSDTYGHHAGSSNPSPGSPNGPRPGGIPRDYLISSKANPATPDKKGDRHPIRAGVSGKVVSVGEGWGAVMVADNSGKPIFRSGHMSGIKVRVGDMVNPNTVIGIQDSIGMSNGYVHAHIEAKTPALHNAWIRANAGASTDTGPDTGDTSTGGEDSGGGGGGGESSQPDNFLGADPTKLTQDLGSLFSILTGNKIPTSSGTGGSSTSASGSSTPTMQSTNPKTTPLPPSSVKPATANTSGSKLTTAQSQLNQSKMQNAQPKITSAVTDPNASPTVINSTSSTSQSQGGRVSTHDQALSGFVYTPLGSV